MFFGFWFCHEKSRDQERAVKSVVWCKNVVESMTGEASGYVGEVSGKDSPNKNDSPPPLYHYIKKNISFR